MILHSTKKRRSLNVCHFHVRSLVSDGRLEQLKFFLSAHSVDVLCLTETWLKPKHVNSMLSVPGFQPPLRRDRITSRGGGVAIYVRDGLASTLRSLSQSELGCIAVRIDMPNRKKLIVFVIYRPSDSNVYDFVDALDMSVSSYLQGNMYMLGDFNAKHILWYDSQRTDVAGEQVKHFTDSHGFHQVVNGPTYHCTSSSPSLLDLIFTNRPTSVISSSVLPSLSDHCAVITSLSLRKPPPPKPYTTQASVYSKAKPVELQNSLSSVDWSTVLSAESLDGITSSWTEVFLSECRKFIPVETLHINPRSKLWYSRYLKYLAS